VDECLVRNDFGFCFNIFLIDLNTQTKILQLAGFGSVPEKNKKSENLPVSA